MGTRSRGSMVHNIFGTELNPSGHTVQKNELADMKAINEVFKYL